MNVFDASFTLGDERARVIADSLKLESMTASHERSKTMVAVDGGRLMLRIVAPDLHALRAAVNTYLKWILMCSHLSE